MGRGTFCPWALVRAQTPGAWLAGGPRGEGSGGEAGLTSLRQLRGVAGSVL